MLNAVTIYKNVYVSKLFTSVFKDIKYGKNVDIYRKCIVQKNLILYNMCNIKIGNIEIVI